MLYLHTIENNGALILFARTVRTIQLYMHTHDCDNRTLKTEFKRVKKNCLWGLESVLSCVFMLKYSCDSNQMKMVFFLSSRTEKLTLSICIGDLWVKLNEPDMF